MPSDDVSAVILAFLRTGLIAIILQDMTYMVLYGVSMFKMFREHLEIPLAIFFTAGAFGASVEAVFQIWGDLIEVAKAL
jgi:hypothetical protein